MSMACDPAEGVCREEVGMNRRGTRFKLFTRCTRLLLALITAFALVKPALAANRTSNDSQEPGSVIVFPKFIRGAVDVDSLMSPKTEIEVGVVCPTGVVCPDDQSVNIMFHWVCPGGIVFTPGTSAILACEETGFVVTATVNGKVVFSPDGVSYDGVTNIVVPAADCPRGYLIGWVDSGGPIKFDGLIGDAVIRISSTAVSAYSAIPIQADPGLMHQDPITLGPGGALVFDGGAGHYEALTGVIKGDVKYARQGPLGVGGTFNDTFLTLLTLDVRSNLVNPQIFVDFAFFGGNPSAFGNENPLSTSASFFCWGEFQLDTDINENLQQAVMGRNGVFVSGPAQTASGVPVTLLGLVEVHEGPAPKPLDRLYFTIVSNDSVPVPTSFVP
jgi:hypothetical protein